MSISVSYQRFSSIVRPFCGDQLQLSQVCGRHHKAKRVLALKHMIVVHIKMSDRFQFFNFCFLYCCRIEVPEGLFVGTTSSVVTFVEKFNKYFKCPSDKGRCKGMQAFCDCLWKLVL